MMSIDLTEQTTPPTRRRKALRSDLFTKSLFEERNLPPDNEKAKTHREVRCLNCPRVKYFYTINKI